MSATAKIAPLTASDETPKVDREYSRKELHAAGRALRDKCPRDSHGAWQAPQDRRTPVDMVLEAEKGRVRELLPLRHARMVRSPFTFYRGSALVMASDLASTASTGVHVQCCGDAHLCNFGGYATPERRVIFSINDLDETLPAPWEWDVKRLAASFVVACRDNGLSDSAAKDVVMTCVRTYRESMAEFSQLNTLDLWYEAMDANELVTNIKDKKLRKRGLKRLKKERGKSIAEDIFPKLVEQKGDMPLIKDQLPTIFHRKGYAPGKIWSGLHANFAKYRDTLPPAYHCLLDRYEIRDAAMKVVGIGAVGTACHVLLLMSRKGDPLFLQIKGQRVVNGYRVMQPASDMFLGWLVGDEKRHYYVRQLRDVKISIRVETFGASEMDLYATWCGRALALSHARAGSSVLLSGYLGKSDAFDKAIARFSLTYADQNEKDHAALDQAVRHGRVIAAFEEER